MGGDMQVLSPVDGMTLEQLAEASATGLDLAKHGAAQDAFFAQMKAPDGIALAAYVGLLQTSLARLNPIAPTLTLQDFVALSAFAFVRGGEAMHAHYNLETATWNHVCAYWRLQIMTKPEHRPFGILLQQEIARLSAGGEPKAVVVTPPTPQTVPPPNMPIQPGPGAGQGPIAPTQGQVFAQQAGQAANAVAGAAAAGLSALGSAFSQALMGPGSKVLVQWSDGNKYPGTVAQMAQGQVLVTMSDGRQLWVPTNYVTAL